MAAQLWCHLAIKAKYKLMEESRAMLEEICKSPLEALIREKKSILNSAGEAIREATSIKSRSFVNIIREAMKK